MGSKVRKDKLRKIIINNKEYYWFIGDLNCDGDYGCIFKIYHNKKVIYKDIIHGETVTPKIVREKILKIDNI